MKIGIDARLYGTKHRGLGRYVQKLVDGVTSADKQNQYVIFLTAENYDSFRTDSKKVKKVLFDVTWYTLKEQTLGLKIINKENVDLMHFPHFNIPIFYSKRFIVTIHDLIIKHFPDSRATNLPSWKYWLKLKGFDQVLKKAVHKPEKIIVPSEFVKNDIINNYLVPEEKIKVIYEGYFLEAEHISVDVSRFDINKPYLLYVGSAYPHKNLERLIKVFKKINSKKEYQLVFVGQKDVFYQRIIKEAAGETDIIFTGHVSEGELVGLYKQARLFIFPSLYEGFGLPPVEAQAHGVPVVSSNRGSLPEVLADSVVYFNPENEEEMLKQIKSVLSDNQLHQQLVSKGLENIKRFSWEKMIKETLELYR